MRRHKRSESWPAMALALLAMAAMAGCTPGMGDGSDNVNTNDNGNANDDGIGNDNAAGNDNAGPRLATFAAIGDYGDDDDDTRAVADLVKSWNPDLIITVGDNDYSDGAYRGTFTGLDLAVGQYFHEYIGNYQGEEGTGAAENRFFPTPGDHDWGDTCDDPEGLDDYLAYFTLPDDGPGGERYYEFRSGDIHFFAIHSLTGCEPDGTSANSVQAVWAEEVIRASDATFKIVYFHNPPYSSGARHIGGGEHMRWPFDEWGVDLVMSGDDHVYERIERDGLTYIVNGLGGVEAHEFVDTPVEGSLARFADGFGALRIDAYASYLDCYFETVDGTVVDNFTIGTVPDGSGGNDNGNDNGQGNGGDDPVLDPDVPPVTAGSWYRPDVTSTWQWQLQPDGDGDINPDYDVEIYDVDLFDIDTSFIGQAHDDGRHVICYFSAGSYEPFRDDADLFDAGDLGSPIAGFEDERWLDVRSIDVANVMLTRLDLAVQKGCDGVEPDNVDGFANDTGFDLTPEDQLAYNRFIANAAHQRGLAVALKNDLDQVPDLVDYYDLMVNEQCHEYDECDATLPFIQAGKPVLNAEYLAEYVENAAARNDLCETAIMLGIRTLVLPLDLDDSFRFSCDDQ